MSDVLVLCALRAHVLACLCVRWRVLPPALGGRFCVVAASAGCRRWRRVRALARPLRARKRARTRSFVVVRSFFRVVFNKCLLLSGDAVPR